MKSHREEIEQANDTFNSEIHRIAHDFSVDVLYPLLKNRGYVLIRGNGDWWICGEDGDIANHMNDIGAHEDMNLYDAITTMRCEVGSQDLGCYIEAYP